MSSMLMRISVYTRPLSHIDVSNVTSFLMESPKIPASLHPGFTFLSKPQTE
jgi:hypothetical protein